MTNAARRPLVVIDGQIAQLPAGDTIDAPASEVDVLPLNNGGAVSAPFGSPVYLSAAGQFQLARANAQATHDVLGLVRDPSIAAGASGSIQTDGLITGSTAQWDAVTGQTGGLTAGSYYFLSINTAGKLTTIAPTSQGEYIQRVGKAITSTSLEISIPFSILL